MRTFSGAAIALSRHPLRTDRFLEAVQPEIRFGGHSGLNRGSELVDFRIKAFFRKKRVQSGLELRFVHIAESRNIHDPLEKLEVVHPRFPKARFLAILSA